MVKVSRDKMRHGVVTEQVNHRTYGVQFDASAVTTYYDVDKIEQVGEAPDVNPIEESEVAIKHDQDKNRLELIPPEAIDAMGRAFTYGAKKYADHNWVNGFPWERIIGSAMRHLNDFRKGVDIDEESGLHQLDCLIANVAMLIAHVEGDLGHDNRRKTNH